MTPPLRAAAILTLWALLLILGTPGFDSLNADTLRTPADRAALRASMAEPWASAGIAVADLNRTFRLPLVAAMAKVQRPFRVSQDWYLYRDGPEVVRRLEIRVDGELRHRSADPAYSWLSDVLRNRRIRPVVESTCASDHGPNWRGLGRLIVERARAEWPAAQSITLTCTEAPFPAPGIAPAAPKVHHGYVATAPEWVVAPA